VSEDEQVKEAPRSTVTSPYSARAERASAEECLARHGLAATSAPPFPHSVVNTRHGVAIGKQEATYNMSCVEESLCQQLFSLINKTDSQPPEGDKCLSRRMTRRSWRGFKQQDGNSELNPWIIAYTLYCFSY